MKKVRSLSKNKIDEISSLIGGSFWDYPYEKGEGGLKPFFPSKQAMSDYMRTFVVSGIESGTLYCTDNGEGYVLITDSMGNHPKLKGILKMMCGMKKALGGWGKLFNFLKKAGAGEETLEAKLKKQKKPYVKVEMLVVAKEYQGQGYMRKLLEFAYKMAKKKNCICILDTDAKGKCDRYTHLGMELYQVRQAAGVKIYDLMYEPER